MPPAVREFPSTATLPADPIHVLTALGFQPARPSTARTEAHSVGRDGWRIVSRRPAMSTLVGVTAIHESAGAGEEAIARAFGEMDRLITIFSRYERTSALAVLNQEGRLDAPPPELALVLSRALTYHRLSAGAFDPTVAPLVDLFRASLTGPEPREPTPAEIAEAGELASVGAITVSRRHIRLTRRGTSLTLDGIAKGFIVDRMAATLEGAGVRRYLVEAGGDIRTGGRKEGSLPWAVAVRDPGNDGRLPGAIHLTGGAVATSGSYERYYDTNRRFHHIVDAARGASPQSCTSATVIAPTATAADALATAVLVLGSRAGTALVEGLPGCTCLVVRSDGRVTRSRGWKEVSE